jgi:hypothetical protein
MALERATRFVVAVVGIGFGYAAFMTFSHPLMRLWVKGAVVSPVIRAAAHGVMWCTLSRWTVYL